MVGAGGLEQGVHRPHAPARRPPALPRTPAHSPRPPPSPRPHTQNTQHTQPRPLAFCLESCPGRGGGACGCSCGGAGRRPNRARSGGPARVFVVERGAWWGAWWAMPMPMQPLTTPLACPPALASSGKSAQWNSGVVGGTPIVRSTVLRRARTWWTYSCSLGVCRRCGRWVLDCGGGAGTWATRGVAGAATQRNRGGLVPGRRRPAGPGRTDGSPSPPRGEARARHWTPKAWFRVRSGPARPRRGERRQTLTRRAAPSLAVAKAGPRSRASMGPSELYDTAQQPRPGVGRGRAGPRGPAKVLAGAGACDPVPPSAGPARTRWCNYRELTWRRRPGRTVPGVARPWDGWVQVVLRPGYRGSLANQKDAPVDAPPPAFGRLSTVHRTNN